jgi:hypothetical protein
MVNLEVYDAYAQQHKQSLLRAAQSNRKLKEKYYSSRVLHQNPTAVFRQLRNAVLSFSWRDSGDVRNRGKKPSRLISG